jgi:starvation-inducible DNA-binding protein
VLKELLSDDLRLFGFMREAHALCDVHDDVASAGFLENWINRSAGEVFRPR